MTLEGFYVVVEGFHDCFIVFCCSFKGLYERGSFQQLL